MSSKASRNQGVQIIASFEDSSIPLNAPAGMDQSDNAGRSASEGVRFLAAFEDDVQRPLDGMGRGALDALNVLFAQHEQNVQKLVNKLQGTIDELKKQNAELKGILLEKDRLLNRYSLNGPNQIEKGTA